MKHLIPWFALKQVPGVGNLLIKRLLDRFGSPEQVFSAPSKELAQVDGISMKIADAITRFSHGPEISRRLETILDKGYGIVTMADPGYPPLLREIPDPPPYLYVHGTPETFQEAAVAVVGSRNATSYGIRTARRLCADLAAHGIVIVSGMALGIDTAAHLGALHAGGKTAAVLGSGLDRVYPRENLRLFDDISKNGAVLTEFDLAAEPEAHHFPARNRIISGMTLGCVVVEAAKKSGSLITARMAAEQNREVFAVPGNIYSAKSTGTHTLIQQGAKLVSRVEDILEEFAYLFGPASSTGQKSAESIPESLSREEHMVVRHMGPDPSHIDDIMRKTMMDPGTLSNILLRLELMGIVSQSPGKFFSLSL